MREEVELGSQQIRLIVDSLDAEELQQREDKVAVQKRRHFRRKIPVSHLVELVSLLQTTINFLIRAKLLSGILAENSPLFGFSRLCCVVAIEGTRTDVKKF